MKTAKALISNDNGDAVITHDGTHLTVDIDEAGENDILDATHIGDSVQGRSNTNLDALVPVTPGTAGKAILACETADAVKAYIGMADHTQSETIDNEGTLTPDSGYNKILIIGTGNADPTTIIFAESGTESNGDEFVYLNTGTTNNIFNNQAGILVLPGETTIKPGGFLHGRYSGGAWYGYATGAIQDYISSINLSSATSGGTIQGLKKTLWSSGTISAGDYMGGGVIHATDTSDIEIPVGYTQQGQSLIVVTETTNQVDVYSLDGSVVSYLLDRTNIGANAFRMPATAGNWAEFEFGADKKLYCVRSLGTVTNAGAVGASCSLYDYYENGNSVVSMGQYAVSAIVGNILVTSDAVTICKVSVYVPSNSGNLSGLRDYYMEIWPTDGSNNLDTVTGRTGVSSVVDGGDIVSSAWNDFTFNQAISATTEYAFVLKSVADGAGDTTATVNASTWLGLGYDNGTNPTTMTNGEITCVSKAKFQADGTITDEDATDFIKMRIFTS